jgi:hypothetical protein
VIHDVGYVCLPEFVEGRDDDLDPTTASIARPHGVFLIGLWVGACLGIFLAGLLRAVSRREQATASLHPIASEEIFGDRHREHPAEEENVARHG